MTAHVCLRLSFWQRIPQCEVNMLQHDRIYAVDCVYMDVQGDTVHLQVPLDMPIQCNQIFAKGTTHATTTQHETTAEATCGFGKPGLPVREHHGKRRFAELQRQQEVLHNQLVSQVGVMGKEGSCDDHGESGADNGVAFEPCSSDLSRMMYQHRGSEVSSSGDTNISSLSGSQLSSSSVLSSRTAFSSCSATSTRSWRTSQGPHRAFVPHSPMDLELGHQVRIMLPSGRISTGTIRFLGYLQGEAELQLGVELQTPDPGLHDGSHKGYSYFECKPGYGAFVPFHKLLMVWE
ncbi:hypothetical protein D5F01_LYC12946 [Larimichthys crocea]|uniref:CAP-Gly domain-containing protein n=1 Tax=Larimichthys crocea TaxID=215358 RepID=A0A6G0ICI8_LARCR|nr:hypothetical protein D5F01_LYC12946 [Larimichthys crocea]